MDPLTASSVDTVELDSVIITPELHDRPSRPPEYETENRALVILARELATSPNNILQKLAETALTLCHAQTAGVSLLESDGMHFRWPALTGVWAAHVGGGTPREFGPCGTVLDRNAAQLMSHVERHFTYFVPVKPWIEEVLLIPFFVKGKAVGTIWVIVHDKSRRFDAEDLRMMTSLSTFASAAYQVLSSLEAVKSAGEGLRASEERLRRQTTQYETLLREAPLGVYLIDDEFRIREMNPTALSVFGNIPDLIGRDFDEVVHGLWRKGYADEIVELFRHTLKTGQPYVTPERIEQRLDRGVTEYYEWQINRIQLPEGRYGVVSYFRDISAQVFARMAVAESQERLRQSAKMEAIGRLAGGLAHDFNNQLQALRGFAVFAASDPAIGARARLDLLEVQKAADRMATLTQQLLAFSRQQVLQPEVLDMDQAVADGYELLRRLIGIHIDFRVKRGEGAKWVRADRTQLQQVLMNLCINGRDAMPESGQLEVGTALRTVASVQSVPNCEKLVPVGQYVQLQVTDTGFGMSSDHLQHVFEPFFTTKEVGKGTGLGLATVEGIIAQSHGYIWAESEPGQGTRFTVLLPLESQPACPPAQHLPVTRPTHKPACVLLVEDEAAVRTWLARTLRNEGYEVVEAGQGREALARLEEHGNNIELVLSDVMMPVMGGKELGERLAADHPDLPLIWMSGYAHDPAFLESPSAHRPWLQKPVTPELLIESIQRLLKQSHSGALV